MRSGEEPKMEGALRRLMGMMEQEVLETFLVTDARDVSTRVHEEAEQYLPPIDLGAREERITKARDGVRDALREWLEAVEG